MILGPAYAVVFPFSTENILSKVMAPMVVRRIVEEIKRLGGVERTYEVTFEKEGTPQPNKNRI